VSWRIRVARGLIFFFYGRPIKEDSWKFTLTGSVTLSERETLWLLIASMLMRFDDVGSRIVSADHRIIRLAVK
jgi:hypothetical protein